MPQLWMRGRRVSRRGSATARRCCLTSRWAKGHVLLLTSGLENLTNDLPLHPVFVAFVDHAGALSFRERAAQRIETRRFIRATASGRGASGRGANVEVIDPDGQRPLSLSEARTVQTLPAGAARASTRFASPMGAMRSSA